LTAGGCATYNWGVLEEVNAMRAVIPEVVPEFVAWRKQTGTDKFDEMWEGVWHMAPAPSRSHQDILADMYEWLRSHWARPRGNRVSLQVNLAPPGGWPKDFRIPDLVLLTPDRFHIDHDVCLEGAPTVVVEIRSPGDETIEKLPFYARLGVPEVWVVDGDTRLPELYILQAGRHEKQSPAADGWLRSAATGVQLRGETGQRLALQLAEDEATRRLLPEA
jgi:Uma2 family endonuclease